MLREPGCQTAEPSCATHLADDHPVPLSQGDVTFTQLNASLLNFRPHSAEAASLGILAFLLLPRPQSGDLACPGGRVQQSEPLSLGRTLTELEEGSSDAVPGPAREMPLAVLPPFVLVTSCFTLTSVQVCPQDASWDSGWGRRSLSPLLPCPSRHRIFLFCYCESGSASPGRWGAL